MVKVFTYRGVLRTFSNRYHFNGGTPADNTHWTTLSDAVVTAEKAIYQTVANAGARITETFGYAAGSEVPVFSKTYATEGTLSPTGNFPVPGDCAALIRYGTSARSSKNHPVYLFNYYHGIAGPASNATPDNVSPTELTALNTYAAHWLSGFSDGSITAVRAGPNGDAATGALVETLFTHRDLPR